jgi:hypothetical protein
VKAVEVHEIMQNALSDTLSERGYVNVRGQRTFWHRLCGPNYILLWIQLGKYGYSPKTGGEFWLNCASGKRITKEPQAGEIVPPTEVCTSTQLRQWQATRRAILSRVVRKPDLGIDEMFREFFEDDMEETYDRGTVAVMPYLEASDVQRWAEFLRAILPVLDAEMTRRLTKKTKQVATPSRSAGRGRASKK